MANDGKDRERLAILNSKFIQLQVFPATPMRPPMLFALDENGRVWNFDFEHKVWVMFEQNRALPA